jgi:hypothetical protein
MFLVFRVWWGCELVVGLVFLDNVIGDWRNNLSKEQVFNRSSICLRRTSSSSAMWYKTVALTHAFLSCPRIIWPYLALPRSAHAKQMRNLPASVYPCTVRPKYPLRCGRCRRRGHCGSCQASISTYRTLHSRLSSLCFWKRNWCWCFYSVVSALRLTPTPQSVRRFMLLRSGVDRNSQGFKPTLPFALHRTRAQITRYQVALSFCRSGS